MPCGHREGPCCEQAGTNLYGTCLHFSRVCTRVALPGHVLPPSACGGGASLRKGGASDYAHDSELGHTARCPCLRFPGPQ